MTHNGHFFSKICFKLKNARKKGHLLIFHHFGSFSPQMDFEGSSHHFLYCLWVGTHDDNKFYKRKWCRNLNYPIFFTLIRKLGHLKMPVFQRFFNFGGKYLPFWLVRTPINLYYSESNFYNLLFENKLKFKNINERGTEFFYSHETYITVVTWIVS